MNEATLITLEMILGVAPAFAEDSIGISRFTPGIESAQATVECSVRDQI